MRASLIRARADAKALRNEVERLRTGRDAVHAAHTRAKKEARQLALRQQAHLVGAVRRIAYVHKHAQDTRSHFQRSLMLGLH